MQSKIGFICKKEGKNGQIQKVGLCTTHTEMYVREGISQTYPKYKKHDKTNLSLEKFKIGFDELSSESR